MKAADSLSLSTPFEKKLWPALWDFENRGVLLVLFALCAALSWVSPAFLTVDNLASVFRAFSFVAIMAVGMSFVIIAGGIDLSVGSSFALASVCTAYAASKLGLSLPLSIILGLLASLVLGVCNGLLVNLLRLPAFIATLGSMSIGRGLAYAISGGYPIAMPTHFNQLGQGSLGPVPYPVLFMGLIGLLGGALLQRTVLGRHIYAVGGGEEAARISGVNVSRVKLIVYGLSALLSAFAGLLTAARLGVAQSTAGLGYELDVIAAVIIGGTSMSGGKGTILGTLTGAAIMGILRNGLVLLDVSAYWQQTVIGLVIVLAVGLDQLRYRTRS